MLQQGQVFKLKGGADETSCWAYRYRVGGRGSRRVQRGGFASERHASEALERALERVRRERGCGSAMTLGELVAFVTLLRGAEERLGVADRGALYRIDSLRADPHREMHTRGG